MAKVKLGAKPEVFKPFPVKFEMPDGTEGEIAATFRYRTQKEYGQMLNESRTKDGQPLPTTADGAIDFEVLYSNGMQGNADFLLKALQKWDLDEALNSENLLQLANEIPAAVVALSAAYGAACRDGKLGNSER